jgi:hypothetical protein
MALSRSRSLWIGVGLFVLLHPGAAMAGCHTDCSLTFPQSPHGCLTCGFRALSDVTCYRMDCDSCDTLSCTATLPSQGELWASNAVGDGGCPLAVPPVSTVKVLRVQRLASRV